LLEAHTLVHQDDSGLAGTDLVGILGEATGSSALGRMAGEDSLVAEQHHSLVVSKQVSGERYTLAVDMQKALEVSVRSPAEVAEID
jgi:hypothetical protein